MVDVTIEIEIDPTVKFRFLWLKYVTGIRLHRHCANALKGEYSARVKPSMANAVITLDEFPAKIFYLCGVSQPYVWRNNFHLAFEYVPFAMDSVERNGIRATVHNAQAIVIRSDYERTPHSHLREFHTCRNWLFANQNQERFNR